MTTFFKELFEFNYHTNQRLIKVIVENSNAVSEKCISLQSHILNAHQIWNSRINNSESRFTVWQIHPIIEWQDIDEENYAASLLILDRFDLNDKIQYMTSQGQPFTNSIRDILFHAINHGTYHRGQIATEFKKLDMEPLITDYIFYKR